MKCEIVLLKSGQNFLRPERVIENRETVEVLDGEKLYKIPWTSIEYILYEIPIGATK